MKKQIYLLLLLAHFSAIKGLEVQGEAKTGVSQARTHPRWSKKDKKAFKKKFVIGGFLGLVGTLVCCSLLNSSSPSQNHGTATLANVIHDTSNRTYTANDVFILCQRLHYILPTVPTEVLPLIRNGFDQKITSMQEFFESVKPNLEFIVDQYADRTIENSIALDGTLARMRAQWRNAIEKHDVNRVERFIKSKKIDLYIRSIGGFYHSKFGYRPSFLEYAILCSIGCSDEKNTTMIVSQIADSLINDFHGTLDQSVCLPNTNGWITCLGLAISEGAPLSIIETLIAKKANLNFTPNKYTKSPLHWAVDRYVAGLHDACAQTLMKAGADSSSLWLCRYDNSCYRILTPLQYAEQKLDEAQYQAFKELLTQDIPLS